jgi:hypothetical protein
MNLPLTGTVLDFSDENVDSSNNVTSSAKKVAKRMRRSTQSQDFFAKVSSASSTMLVCVHFSLFLLVLKNVV